MDLTHGKADVIAATYKKLCELQRMHGISPAEAKSLIAHGVPVESHVIRPAGYKEVFVSHNERDLRTERRMIDAEIRAHTIPLSCAVVLRSNMQKVATPTAMVACMLRTLSVEEIDSMFMLLGADEFVDTIADLYNNDWRGS